MQITSNNMRRTTMEHHRPTRRYFIQPNGAERKIIEKRMPKVDFVPTLWMDAKQLIVNEYKKI